MLFVQMKTAEDSTKTTFFTYLLSASILITVLQQLPIVRETFYQPIRLIIYSLFCFLLLIVIAIKPFNRYPRPIIIFSLIAFAVLFLTLLASVFGIDFPFSEILQLLIPLGIMICAYWSKFQRRKESSFLALYVFLAIAMGVANALYYTNFKILPIYLIPDKNQIGIILAISSVIVVFSVSKSGRDKYPKYKSVKVFLQIVSFLALFASLLVIRNRSGIVALMVILPLLCYRNLGKRYSWEKQVLLIVIIMGLVILLFTWDTSPLAGIIIKSLTLNRDIGDIESLSAGRMSVWTESLNFIKGSPLFGDLFTKSWDFGTSHNYFLNKITKYGIIGSFPMLIIYLYLWFFSTKGIISDGSLVYWVLQSFNNKFF